mgnify:CR=1 FL=1|jgi:hypothetical protein
MFETFYNETIRNTIVAFGSLFNEIYVVRKDNSGNETSRFKVPITYAPKEKFIRMLNEYSGLKGTDNERDISTLLPRIGFNIEAMNYDAERKRNTLSQRFAASDRSNQLKMEYAEVPYSMDLMLTVASRTMEDGLQILEQILAYFTPEFTVSLNLTETRTKIDVPIVLTGVATEIDFEGDSSTQRSIIFNLTFAVRTYVYGPTKTSKIITTVDTTFFNADFGITGGISGSTQGALARLIIGATGPSGATSDINSYTGLNIFGSTTDRENSIFEYPDTLSVTGGTMS